MAHYFETEPTSTSCEKNIKVFINDTHFSFFTDNDVFSKKGLDFGTRTLLESLDINNRAVELSKKNSKINRVTTNVFQSNMYENVKDKYNYIISNPPIRVGNEILYKILIGAKEHLNKKGHLIFVINKNQGAKTVAKKLEDYYEINVINKNKGFFVIDCQNH